MTLNVGIDGMEKEKFVVVVEFDLIMKGNPQWDVFLVVKIGAWLKFVPNSIGMAFRRISLIHRKKLLFSSRLFNWKAIEINAIDNIFR